MKKITAYVNTVRVHWLVEELEAMGIEEIMVTEYFSPSSKISRMELLAQDDAIEMVREIIHRVGTTGGAGDHSLFIEEYDPSLPSQIPLGKRTSKLEESRMKQLVNFLLHGSHRKIRAAFLFIVLSILGVAVFVSIQTKGIEESVEETNATVQLLSETINVIESALLEEMLAVERFHRGEPLPALEDFREARAKLTGAITHIKEADVAPREVTSALADLEDRFHLLADGMFGLAHTLSKDHQSSLRRKSPAMSAAHMLVMASLDDLRLQLLVHLTSFQRTLKELMSAKRQEMYQSIREVRISLLLLVGAAIGVTVAVWLMVERKVSRPIQKLVEESNIVDTVKLS